MSDRPAHGWQSVREEVLRRIAERIWQPGDAIPNEVDLAAELGCARATVNRALRSLSDDGLLDRRRKGGTRIAPQPVGKATIDIPLIRTEITERGDHYSYRLIERQEGPAPDAVLAAFGIVAEEPFLHLISLHLADDKPYALEDRWIDLCTVPEARGESFEAISANEWLVRHLPFTRAESEFTAVPASDIRTKALSAAPGDALIVHRRRTWLGDKPITQVDMTFAPGHWIRTQ